MEDVVGEPEIDEHGDKAAHEPPHSRDYPAVSYIVGFGMEGAVEGNSCQVGGPDSLGRIDEESTGQAGETITYKVDGEGHGNWNNGRPEVLIGAVGTTHSGIQSWKRTPG